MSDEVFQVATEFADVASLAQGYMERADGERILLALPAACDVGSPVRFVVTLADGTPAFAGAGRCVEHSDQGESVAVEHRFETLLDELHFDERSQPVYDYIVAVRNAAYADAEEVDASDALVEEVAQDEPQMLHDFNPDDEPTQYSTLDARAADAAAVHGETTQDATGEDEPEAMLVQDDELGEQLPVAATAQATDTVDFDYDAGMVGGDLQPAAAHPETTPSFVPEAIPTGILTRPALAVHWSPAPARRPTARPSTGLFQYNGNGLPRPAGPPRPDLDPALWVTPAPRPGRSEQALGAGAAQPVAATAYESGGFEDAGAASLPAAPVEDGELLEVPSNGVDLSEPPLSVRPDELEISDDDDPQW